jgi:hypothetical protein
MIKLWNEVKKEVIKANQGKEQHIINAVTKFVFDAVKSEVKTEKKEINVELINELMASFWNAHNQEKKCTNPTSIRGYAQEKINIATKIVNITTNCEKSKEYFELKAGKFSSFITKYATAFIPTLNQYGKLGSYAKFA